MVRSSTLAVIGLSLIARSAAAWDCALSLGDSHFNLETLDKVHTFDRTVPTPPTNTKYSYKVSVCQPLPLTSAPPEEDCPEGTHVCALVSSVREGHDDYLISVIPFAGGDNLSPTAAYVEGQSTVEKGWLLSLGGGRYNEVDQRVEVEMVCDAGADKDTKPTYVDYDSVAGKLSLKWVTAAACSTDGGAPTTPPPTDDKGDDKDKDDKTTPPPSEPEKKKKSSGMGFFSWFFTLCFLAFAAYFVVGCYRNYTDYGATGWDMIPNRDVWRDLPYIIQDLFRGRGGSRSGYSSLG